MSALVVSWRRPDAALTLAPRGPLARGSTALPIAAVIGPPGAVNPAMYGLRDDAQDARDAAAGAASAAAGSAGSAAGAATSAQAAAQAAAGVASTITTQVSAIVAQGAADSATAFAAAIGDAQANLAATTAAYVSAVSGLTPVSPIDLIRFDDGLAMPKIATWQTSAGRMKRLGQCIWAKCLANEPRLYINNAGGIDGVLFDGAEVVRSADYFTAPANSASPQYLTAVGTGAAVAQVGSHAQPDISGGTGKLAWCTAGTSLASFKAANLGQALVAGDVLRVGALIRVPTTGAAWTARLGTAPVSGTANGTTSVINVAADGTVTMTANGAAAVGVDLFDTDAAGNRWWRVWNDIAIIATGTLAPQVSNVPAATPGIGLMLWSVKNPTLAVPSVVPVMADGALLDDGVRLGASDPLEVEWSSLCVGRTSVSDGLLVPPRMAHTPPLAVERRITVRKAAEVTGVAYALPGPRQHLLFPNLATKPVNLRLGPGYWGGAIMASAATSYAISGAYADPRKWPRLRAFSASGANPTAVTLDKVCFWLRVPQGATAASNSAHVNLTVGAGKITIGDMLVVGADWQWSPYNGGPEGNPGHPFINLHYGMLNIAPTAAGSFATGRIKTLRANGGMKLGGSAGITVNASFGGYASDRHSTDHVQGGIAGGALNMTFGHHVQGELETTAYSFYQTAHEIEVDIGAGWQTMTAAGVADTALPTWRRFYQYGSHAGGVITAAPKPDMQMWVPSWAFSANNPPAGTVTKLHYQFSASYLYAFDKATRTLAYIGTNLPDGAVWVSDAVGAPSPTNPRIRIRGQASRWTSGGVAGYGGPLVVGDGYHGDNLQVVSGSWSYNCQNVLWINSGGLQGFFSGTGATCTAFSARGFMAVAHGNALTFNGAGSFDLAGVMTAKWGLQRYSTGNYALPVATANTGQAWNCANLLVSTNASNPAGRTLVGTGTMTGPVAFGINRVTGYTTLTDVAVDQPAVTFRNEQLFPVDCIENGYLASWITPSNLRTSGYLSERVGFDMQALIDTCQQGAWGMFAELEAQCVLGAPTHAGTVSNAAAAGTAITLTPVDNAFGATLKGSRIIEGDPRQQFAIAGGVLKANGPMTDYYGAALVDNLALVTDAGERIRVKVA